MTNVLVVDDEHGLAEVLAAALTDMGFRVRTAANGVQALERMREIRPDLVLLDYMLPLLDGPGVLAAARAHGLDSMPVILMSSLPEAVVRARCQPYAAFLRKPFAFEDLFSVIELVRAR